MDLDKLMDVVKETFDDEVYAELDDFAGDPYVSMCGKDEFFKKLKMKLSVLMDNENQKITSELDPYGEENWNERELIKKPEIKVKVSGFYINDLIKSFEKNILYSI